MVFSLVTSVQFRALTPLSCPLYFLLVSLKDRWLLTFLPASKRRELKAGFSVGLELPCIPHFSFSVDGRRPEVRAYCLSVPIESVLLEVVQPYFDSLDLSD